MHIRTLGDKVELCRWKVDYTIESVESEDGTPCTEYVPTEEEADYLVEQRKGSKSKIDTAADEWIDGITVESHDQALEIAKMGEKKYKQWLQEQQSQTPASLKEQLDKKETEIALLKGCIMELTDIVYGEGGGML